jgi:hypothetical protein
MNNPNLSSIFVQRFMRNSYNITISAKTALATEPATVRLSLLETKVAGAASSEASAEVAVWLRA